ncbi:MAG: hypothetical protein ACXVDD_14805 [Polyangia bacterium]
MSAKKNCAACGKQIPDVAVVCVFCSATQPSADPELAAAADAATQDVVSKHATDPTLIGIKASDVAAALQDKLDSAPATVETGSNGASAAHPATTLEALTEATDGGIPEPTVEAPTTTTQRLPIIEAEPWGGLGRLIMGIGGGVLIALFFCPWHGASSWQLLETLAGADFVRQLFYLTGGIVLLACALLPLPSVFRAAVGTAVAAMPVLLGAGGVIEGWRGVVATLAILGLPATHLLRSRAQSSPAARGLVLAAVAAVALLYLLPVSSVIPLALIIKMMGSGVGAAIFGVFLLIPLVFAALSLTGVLGRDLTDIAVLLSVLILLWAPVGMALRGIMIEDATQLYVAVGLLWASATAALSLAQLLSLAAARTTRAA